MERLHRWRLRRSLTTGLRRSLRWKHRLYPLMKAIRADLYRKDQPVYRVESELMAYLHLPQELEPHQETLEWALTTLEDLYLLLVELETSMTNRLSLMSKRP